MHKFRWMMGPLMDAAGDANGGGGGNSGSGNDGGHDSNEGGNNDGGNNDGGNADDQPLTKNALAELLKSLVPDLVKTSVAEQVNGLDKKLSSKIEKMKPVEPVVAKPKKDDDPFKDDRVREAEERIARIEKEREKEREENRRRSAEADIKTSLSDFQFRDGDERGIAFDYYRGKVRWNDDGELVIDTEKGEVNANVYIKGHVPRYFKGMLQARDIGGSGNQSKGSKASNGGPDINNIKPGMSPEQDSQIRQAIADLFASARNNS